MQEPVVERYTIKMIHINVVFQPINLMYFCAYICLNASKNKTGKLHSIQINLIRQPRLLIWLQHQLLYLSLFSLKCSVLVKKYLFN